MERSECRAGSPHRMTRRAATSGEVDDLRRRVDELGAEVARLKQAIRTNGATKSKPWWAAVAGRFDGDPVFAAIVRQGRTWRAAQRPRADRARS